MQVMIRRRAQSTAAVLACLLLVGCGGEPPSPAADSSSTTTARTTTTPSATPPPDPVDVVLAGLDRRAQVAQLFVIGVPLADLSGADGLVTAGVGGIFLHGRSSAPATQLARPVTLGVSGANTRGPKPTSTCPWDGNGRSPPANPFRPSTPPKP